MKKIWETWKKWLLGLLMGGLFVFLGFAMVNAYQTYRRMIVEQQQQHLLLQTHAVTQNLELYFSEQLRELTILTQLPGFLGAMGRYYENGEEERVKEYVYSYMLANQQGLSRVYLLDREGKPVFHYSQYPFLKEFEETALPFSVYGREAARGIGGVFPIAENHYGLTLVCGIYGSNGYLGSMVNVYDMDDIDKRFLRPLSMENLGYITVKDDSGTVLMHPARELLGFNAKDMEGFQDLPQYASMRKMLEEQYLMEEGTAVYQSYTGGIWPPEREISAFSRMNFLGTSWYISASIPYHRAMAMEMANLRRFGLLAGAVLTVVLAAGAAILILLKNRQKLTLETKYLKEINQTLEELGRSREETRHYQKLTTIGALAGGIVHEFNNLLTPILGYSEFLQGQLGEDSEYFEDIAEIHRAGIRAKEIVERILPFSRKETNTGEFKIWKVSVLVEESIRTISVVMLSNIRLERRLEDGGARIRGDATQIHQVLLNLYSNALASMEGRGGVLTVETRRIPMSEMADGYPEVYSAEQDTDYVEIRVSDTGCGMSGEVLSQIFNPFFTTKASGEGTGLGLSVAKDILISHGGFIRAESRLGEGSCFSACLPVYRENGENT